MNRRKFIASAVVGAIVAPKIAEAMATPKPPEMITFTSLGGRMPFMEGDVILMRSGITHTTALIRKITQTEMTAQVLHREDKPDRPMDNRFHLVGSSHQEHTIPRWS